MCNSVHAHSMDNSKGEPNVNCGPWVTGTFSAGSSTVTDVPYGAGATRRKPWGGGRVYTGPFLLILLRT